MAIRGCGCGTSRSTSGALERDRWLVAHGRRGRADLCAGEVPDGVDDELMAYFVPAAEHLRNDTGLPISTVRNPGG